MPEDQNPRVVFRVRVGKNDYTCKGYLMRDGGLVYGIPDETPQDCPFLPDRVRLEESDLELKHDAVDGDWYQYHGYIFVY